MTRASIQFGSSVIQLTSSVKETEGRKGETDTTLGKRWNISKIKKSLIATNTKKYKDMTNGDDNSNSVFLFKDQNKFEIKKYKKEKKTFTQSSQ